MSRPLHVSTSSSFPPFPGHKLCGLVASTFLIPIGVLLWATGTRLLASRQTWSLRMRGGIIAGLGFILLGGAAAAYYVWEAGDVLGCGIFWCVGDQVDVAEVAAGPTPKCGAVVAYGVVGSLGCLVGAVATLVLAISLLPLQPRSTAGRSSLTV